MPSVLGRRAVISAAFVLLCSSPALAQTEAYTWNTNSSGFWDTASNWNRAVNGVNVDNNNQAPDLRTNFTVSATINRSQANPTVTYRSGSRAVDRLTVRERFALTGGTLGVGSQGGDFEEQFVQSGGRLEIRSSGSIEFHPPTSGADDTWDSGTWGGTGTGRFGVIGGANVVIRGTDGTAVNTLERRLLRTDDVSSMTLTANDSATGNAQGGRLLLTLGARIENYGLFTLEQAAGGPRATFTSPDGTGLFTNFGDFDAPTSGATVYLGEGMRTVNLGTMNFTGGGVSYFTGTFENAFDEENDGSLYVGDDLTDQTELVITRGGYNAALITVSNGSTLSLIDNSFENKEDGDITLDNSTLTIARSLHVSRGEISGSNSNVRLLGSAVLENRGTLTLDVAGTASHTVIRSDDASGVVNNVGYMSIDGGDGEAVIGSGVKVVNRPGADMFLTEQVRFSGRLENVAEDGKNWAGNIQGISDLTLGDGGYSEGTIDLFGSLTLDGNNFIFGSQSFTRSFSGITFDSGSHVVSGVISTDSVVRVNGGTVLYDGASNSVQGTPTGGQLVVSGGRLTLTKASVGQGDSFGASARTLEVFPQGRVVLAAPEQIGTQVIVNGNGDGVTAQLELTTHHESLDRLSLSNGGVRASGATGRFYLGTGGIVSSGNSFLSTGLYLPSGPTPMEIRVNDGTLLVDTEINENGGAGAISKTGSGRLILQGRERFTGGIKVTNGIVEMTGLENHILTDAEVSGPNSQLILDKVFVGFFEYGASLKSLTILNGGTVLLKQGFQIADQAPVTLNGGTLNLGLVDETIGNLTISNGLIQGGGNQGLLIRVGGSTITAAGGQSTVNSNVTLGDFKSIDVASNAKLTVNGRIQEIDDRFLGGIVKTGPGTLALQGVNTLHGGLFILSGTVEAGADGNLGDVNADTVLNGATSTLRVIGSQFNGTRTVRVTGDGGVIDTGTFAPEFRMIYGAPSGVLVKAGSGELRARKFDGPTLRLDHGSVSLLYSAVPSTNRIESLFLTDETVRLDISNSVLVLGAINGCDNVQSIRDWVQHGYNGGDFLGTGITSTLASAQWRIGFGGAGTLNITEVGGQPVSAAALIVKLTRPGDTNLDAQVNFQDLLTLAQNYGQSDATWTDGDFDYNGNVNFDDLLSLAQFYNGAALDVTGLESTFTDDWTLARSLVPEPTLLYSCLTTGALQTRKRRVQK